MSETGKTETVFDRIWSFFSSVRLSVVVLVLLALTSIIGTLIPQNQTAMYYYQNYGEFILKIFSVFQLFDMYHSWWFRFLVLILAMNITVCSLERLPNVLSIVRKKPVFDAERFRRYKGAQDLTVKGNAIDRREAYVSVVSKKFGSPTVVDSEKGFTVFSERGRYTRLGVYVVHASILFLILGSLIGSLFGYEGFVNIPEGEAKAQINLRNSDKTIGLDFQVRCDDFEVTRYDNGAPKEYRSNLTIIENGKEVLKKRIIVNDPLHYKGINFFQSSFGSIPGKNLTLSFTSKASGMVYEKKIKPDETVELEENLGTFVLQGFLPSYPFMGQDLGESYIGSLSVEGKEPEQVVLPLHFAMFDKMRKGAVSVGIVNYDSSEYTGLQVTRDPGVYLVYLGFTLMIVGCYIAFFMAHQSLCVEVVQSTDNTCRVMVSGTANKNRMGMVMIIKKIASQIETA
ncbi:MAG: cytochrome c biogenesis protein ResB [Desulfobacteraceae bacterium]|jgi:cytochrome c biogenesis protein